MNTPGITPSSERKALTKKLMNEFDLSLLSASRAAEYMIKTHAEPYLYVSDLPDSLWIKSINPDNKCIYMILCVSISGGSNGEAGEYQVSTIHSQEGDPKILNNTSVVVSDYLSHVEKILAQDSD